MSIPVFAARHVLAAVSPSDAVEAVRRAFVEHASGAWSMPAKVYVEAPPDGDFRAMPASGAGHAVLKWVTSFTRNPERGLPTVTGLLVLSDATNGQTCAVMDTGAVTALRTGAAAVLAAETLARPDAATTAVIGCGVNGRAAARTLVARGRHVVLHDAIEAAAVAAAAELGAAARVASDLQEARSCDIVVTVTPGREAVFPHGTLRAGQHVSLMGADGPGKAEIAIDELLRCRIVCDEWGQASHNGDISHAAEAGRLERDGVAELGRVLDGREPGRTSADDITAFDSTGLAVQDLALALAVWDAWQADPASAAFAGVSTFEL